jgi:c-di-GMP-binding flagellar brake protein YcgR
VDILTDQEYQGQTCCGTVVKVGRGRIFVQILGPHNILSALSRGSPVFVVFTTNTGVGRIRAEVVRVGGRGRPVLELKTKTKTAEKRQRREYFRVRNSRKAKISRGLEKMGCGFLTVETKDISGGGVLVDIPGQPVFIGEQIELRIFLPGEDGPIAVKGAVTRVSDGDGAAGGCREVGIEFTSITEAAREAIIRYLFRAERSRLGKRKRKQAKHR